MSAQDTIFVLIASYRDRECQWTVKDLFEKAAHPERVRVGICWQFDEEKDQDCFVEPYPYPKQVRVKNFSLAESKGAGWAREQARALMRGEKYVLQIQPHMRFAPGWDETLIEMLGRCPGEKSALSGWLPAYSPKGGVQDTHGGVYRVRANRMGKRNDAQVLHLIKIPPPEVPPPRPRRSAFWVGNFLFAPAAMLDEVPFDPHIYFWGEELNYSVRLWTHGWDIYQYDRPVAYHFWDRRDTQRFKVNKSDALNLRALARNLHLFGIAATGDKAAKTGLKKYGLGTVRSVDSFWPFAGLDLKKWKLLPHATTGQWDDPLIPSQSVKAAQERIFVLIPSFCDTECQWTIRNLFAQAERPERVFIGVCLQYAKEEERDLSAVPQERVMQVRVMECPAAESRGANWARHQAWKLWEGEEYVLQIDAHHRFEKNWDRRFIAQLQRCPSPKAVLTSFMPSYEPPDTLEPPRNQYRALVVRTMTVGKHPQPVHVSSVLRPIRRDMAPLPTPVLVAHCVFAPSAAYVAAPPDPHLYFYGDELNQAARLWTHGWDIFQLPFVIGWHQWNKGVPLGEIPYKNDDRNWRGQRRLLHLFGIRPAHDRETVAELEHFGLGRARSIEDYWRYSGLDLRENKAAEVAQEGLWGLYQPAPEKPQAVVAAGTLPRIFVQIPAYRDPECQWTVKDLFEKAKHPERVFVGICWQFDPEEDKHCFAVPYPRPEQVRVIEVNARDAKGACWARSQVQTLWQGEEYTLQIDSHMRFEQDWDALMLDMLSQCDSPRPVLTSYPPAYTPPDKLKRKDIFRMVGKEFDEHGIFLMGSVGIAKNPGPERPIPGAFAGACFIFASSDIIREVPYDPLLYFFGEEITLAVRLWTHGWDFFHPHRHVVFHDWDREKRPTHFSDHPNWAKRNNRSFRRVKHLLGTEECEAPNMIRDLDKYGLGTARTLEQYQAFSGVNFAAKTIAKRAFAGKFPRAHPPSAAAIASRLGGDPERDRIFVQIASYRDRECQWTVKDLFEKAKYPERIFVGICWQFDEEEDKDCFTVPPPRPEQVRVFPVDWRKGEGVCWARHQTQQLWEGEEYTLQIDSHMRFLQDWDMLMLEELSLCPSDKAVLSSSPAAYTPPDNLQKNPPAAVRRTRLFDKEGNLRFQGEMLHRHPEHPLRGAFVAAGFVFSRAQIIRDVPYDPYLYFDQEEITYSARLFTHGWDVYSTRRPLLYHYYNQPGPSVRPLHWQDARKHKLPNFGLLHRRGIERFNHLSGYRTSGDPEVVKEINQYGFGRTRTLQEFEEFTGIDFKQKKVSRRALKAEFIEGIDRYRDQPIHVPEIDGDPAKPQQGAPADGRQADAPRVMSLLPQPGDVLPMFILPDHEGVPRHFELQGGRYTLLYFIPSAQGDYLQRFFDELKEEKPRATLPELNIICIVPETPQKLAQLKAQVKIPFFLWADHELHLSRSLGLYHPGQQSILPAGFLLNRNLQVVHDYVNLAPEQLARNPLADFRALDRTPKAPPPIAEQAPVLIVPNTLSPDFCRRCIQAFETGPNFPGTVGAEEKTNYRPGAKIRSDHIVTGRLLREIDERLARSLLPEIKKAFGFEATHRERYKVGCYKSEEGGFFNQHRDNFDSPLGYRRLAVTINLNADFEGGNLNFPEYGDMQYRPAPGSAIAFPCALMHQALPVTSGKRYLVVGFFHGDEDEAYRRHYLRSQGKPINAHDFEIPKRQFPGVPQSREFYARWHDQAVVPSLGLNGAAVEQNGSGAAMGNGAQAPRILINRPQGNELTKVLETPEAIVYDNFLPDDVYERLQNYVLTADYRYINTSGRVERVWHMHDGHPLRSMNSLFTFAEAGKTMEAKNSISYPSQTDFDLFAERMNEIAPQVKHLVGAPKLDWEYYTGTVWLYPPGTGLSMHIDGSGIYTGAYVYFVNPVWKLHWGGLLLLIDEHGNRAIHEFQQQNKDARSFHRKYMLHASEHDDLAVEAGFARCIFPKKNRLVFIAPDAYHMITKVNQTAGDNVRMTIAGFFNRGGAAKPVQGQEVYA